MRKDGRGQQQPPADQQGRQGDQSEEKDPGSPRDPGEPGEVVGVRDRAAAPTPVALQLEDRAQAAKQQEPGRRVPECRLHGRAGLDRHHHGHRHDQADRQHAVGVADRQERRGQDHQH
jgi:hypothetical protein